jgi:hypothetical protein
MKRVTRQDCNLLEWDDERPFPLLCGNRRTDEIEHVEGDIEVEIELCESLFRRAYRLCTNFYAKSLEM